MCHRLLASAFLGSLLVASLAAARPIRFAKAKTFPSGITHTARVAVGDFNGDGYPDLAVSSTWNSVAVFLGKGDGTFSGPTIYQLTYYVTGAVAVGDFNGDGKLDMAVVGGDEAGNGLAFFAGKGDGTFDPPQYFPTALARAEISATAGDFNNDNILDIFTGGNGNSELILGNGEGNFQDGPLVGVGGFDVAAGDFNHDGNLDVALTQPYSGGDSVASVNVVLGNGDGTFLPAQPYTGFEEPLGIAVGDFNHDGKLDLAVTDYVADTIVVLLGNGDGTFTNIGQWYAGTEPGSVAVADFNMDGKLDLAVADFGYDAISVLPGDGHGTFPNSSYVTTAAAPSQVVTADLNRDGSPDLVVVNNGADSVSVLLNAEGTYVRLKSSRNPSNVGQAVTLTATVKGSVVESPAPSGIVTFKNGSKTLGSAHLSEGKASFTTSGLSKGSHDVTATYSGDGNFNPNQSGVLIQDVH